MLKKVIYFILLLIGILILGYQTQLKPRLPILNGFAAKCVCSATFIAERDYASIQQYDLSFGPIHLAKNTINFETKSVESSVYGLVKRKAVYIPGYGCTLLPQTREIKNINTPQSEAIEFSDSEYWPEGERMRDTLFSDIRNDKLNQAIQNAFTSKYREGGLMTSGVVVVYNGELIAEKYAEGFDKKTPVLGWSMTKSIINALIGILVKEEKMDLDHPVDYEEWKNDNRQSITLHQLLQMSSGLDWNEEYGTLSDVTKMLYLVPDIPSFADDPKLRERPGGEWYYSSGTSNIISGIIRNQFESHKDYLEFPRKALFNKIGMHSAVMELDPSGNFIGSSYCHATPRDWAKFGLLYLNNGKWNGERLFTDDWIEYTKTPAQYSNGIYGAHFWLNADRAAYPDAPDDLFSANGFQGQRVFIVPSKNIVIVRMGYSEDFDFNGFLRDVLEAF